MFILKYIFLFEKVIVLYDYDKKVNYYWFGF